MLDTASECLLGARAGVHLGRMSETGPSRIYHRNFPTTTQEPHQCVHFEAKYGRYEAPRISFYLVWKHPDRHGVAWIGGKETKVKLNPVRRRHIFSILVGEVANIKDALDQAAELSAPHAVASVMGMKIPRPRKTRQLKLKEADPPVEDYPA